MHVIYDHWMSQLQTIIDSTSSRALGQVICSRKNKELREWLDQNTTELGDVTITEKVWYLITGKPNVFCENNKKRTFRPKTSDYGFCNNMKHCQCLREHWVETYQPRDMSDVIEKRKKTWLEKYGVENASQSEIVKAKAKATVAAKDNSVTRHRTRKNKETVGFHQVIDRVSEKVSPKFARDDYFGSRAKNKYPWECNTCQTIFTDHVDYGHIPRCYVCYPKKISEGEIQLREFVNSLGIETINNVTGIIGKLQIALEYNGVYWHSEEYRDADYHVNKYLASKEIGIKLIQVFSDEWDSKPDIVKSRITNILGLSPRIYARKCEVRTVPGQAYKEFTEKHHLQGYAGASVKLGLYHNNDLVAVMSFGKARYDKTEYEMIRFCSNGTIVGGASKLFKYFVKTYNPKSIVSYANRCWSDGGLYRQLGFTDITENIRNAGYWYIKNDIRYHRSNFTKAALVKQGNNPNKTESQIMKEIGGHRIYDCGNYKFLWEAS